LTTLAYTALIGVLATSALMPFLWLPPAPMHWFAMIGLGLLGGIGHFALIKAFQFAPAATVTPFGYSNLIWAVLFGYLFFGDLPDGWTVSGALVIAGSGLYIAHRERALARQART
jgi:drug/metabolite transporter (DMT)-like permease